MSDELFWKFSPELKRKQNIDRKFFIQTDFLRPLFGFPTFSRCHDQRSISFPNKTPDRPGHNSKMWKTRLPCYLYRSWTNINREVHQIATISRNISSLVRYPTRLQIITMEGYFDRSAQKLTLHDVQISFHSVDDLAQLVFRTQMIW